MDSLMKRIQYRFDFDNPVIKKYQDISKEKRTYNFYKYKQIENSDEAIARYYYADYIKAMLVDSQEAYNMLEEEYKKARFENIDIFRENMHNKIIETPLEAWLTFLTDDNPERVIELITRFPEFKPMYETLYQMCLNVERMMDMFSEELRIMDRNTVKYMIEEQEQEIKEKEQQLEELDLQLEAYRETQRRTIEKLLRKNIEVEEVASIVECDVSYVEDVKRTME